MYQAVMMLAKVADVIKSKCSKCLWKLNFHYTVVVVIMAKNTYKILKIVTEYPQHPLYLTINSGGIVCEYYQLGLSIWTIVANTTEGGYDL